MDNQHKIGCRFGANDRTKIIDPNAFYGELDSSRNIPVRTEDLTISVKLTTTKKSRTTITSDDSGNKIVKEQKGATINFIEGSEVNGKKVLTTKYTQLTTEFDKDEINPETFGITNIDIDFNSSYTPIIKIDFVDVRGSSIFQNEEELTENNSKNKYTTFFEFPYPMFELEIKGYYGQPVTYCLHMTKFNSKFNSNTGNFEISCEFIGYTYALLSDMLVGFLKVIPLTTIGKSIFDSHNKEREDNGKPKLLTLGELRKKIAEISKEIQQISQNYEETKIIKSFQDANSLLSSLNLNLNSLNDQFSIDKKPNSTEVSEYSFIILEDVPFSKEKNIKNNEINNEIKETVKKYNELKIEGLNISEIDFASPIMLTDLTLNKLEPDYDLQPFGPFKNLSEIESFKKDLKNYIKNNYDLASDKKFRVFDLRSRYKILNNQKSLVETSLKDANKALAVKIKEDVSVKLSFDPTVRNMVEIFTNLIEVFMETMYTVSHQAEENIERRSLLQSIFGQDLKKSDYTETINYWPWPDYREKDGKTNAYVDTYLGLAPELRNNISDINELVFIDELLQAFLTAKQEELKDNLADTANETLFIPSNPLDTKVFEINGNPYAKVDIIKTEQALRVFLIRAMTFLGYSNNQDYLTTGENGEIRTMAKLEARMLYDALINPKVKGLFKYTSLDTILKTIGKISNDDRFVVTKTTTGDYTYNYVNKEDGLVDDFKLLPIGYDINGEDLETPYQNEPTGLTHLKQEKLIEYASSGKLFLTNYGAGLNVLGSDSIDNYKFYDGGVYISIKTPNDIIPEATQIFYDTNINREMVLDLKSLKDDKIESAGFNSFGGSYGVPDFNKINFGEDIPNETPSMYIFYSNTIGVWNGLAESREASGVKKSKWDFNSNGKYPVVGSSSSEKIHLVYYNQDNSISSKLHKNLGLNRTLASNIKNGNVTYPYINYMLKFNGGYFTGFDFDLENFEVQANYGGGKVILLPLFGSKWYYSQTGNIMTKNNGTPIYNVAENYVRGLLFLNTLPFNVIEEGVDALNTNKNDPFINKEIQHLFDIKAGFIHAPKLWLAYVGGLLWWLSEEDPDIENGKIVHGGRGKNDPINWKKYCDSNDETFWECKPGKNQYLPKFLLEKAEDIDKNSILFNLPIQVQDEFKKYFFDFINNESSTGVSFNQLKKNLEIYEGSSNGFCTLVDNLLTNRTAANPNGVIDNGFIDGSLVKNSLKNTENYSVIIPRSDSYIDSSINYNYIFLELKDDSAAVNLLKEAFNEELIIVNTGYKIWKPNKYQQYRQGISVNKYIFEEYVNAFTTELSGLTYNYSIQGEEEKQLSEVFGSKNKDTIKLMLYKYCKNIYDKWIGGVENINNIIFQCGDNSRTDSNRKQTDTKLAEKYGSGKARLIDSFRFVTRSFRDIGDELFIDPRPIEEQISDFPNTSSYSVISGLLNDNKFEFHALPTFINFKDDKMLESVFTPQEYGNSITSCGPTFVCVYTGQHSKSLDISSGRYPNDGFDMRCDSTTIPDDFKNALESHEDPIAVFEVNYSQQNQNIFKNISLDQSEFSETEESLKIIQDISMNGFENKPTYAGQNMYNIYGVRSYSAEIEMLGNPMIQPMMYFQLNNIPMFHGAYMIIRTRHNIKPNHMTTWFTGTRIRAVETPLIDVTEAYMSLVETLDLSDVKGSTNSRVSTSTSGTSSASTRAAKKSIPCNAIKKSTTDFYDNLKLVVDYLEGSYCKGGISCGSNNSGETLWGLDRKNHTGPLDDSFWVLVDQEKNKPSLWNASYPKPKDKPNIFTKYSEIIKLDYDKFMKSYIKNDKIKDLINSDGRLMFNVIYAVYNGAGWFKGFSKILESEYNSGKTTSDELLEVFVNERVSGGYNALKGVNKTSATLIANTGVDIQKLVGLSSVC